MIIDDVKCRAIFNQKINNNESYSKSRLGRRN